MWKPTIACPNLVLLRRLVRDHGRTYGPRYALVFGLIALVSGCTALSALMMKGVADDIFVAQDQRALLWLPVAIIAIFVTKGMVLVVSGRCAAARGIKSPGSCGHARRRQRKLAV